MIMRVEGTRNRTLRIGAVLAGCFLGSAATLGQAPPDKTILGRGEITGDDVYVRSGPSLNHYPVCKLDAGTRVTVVGETGEWYEIKPPDGVFSFISGDYVDSGDGRTGVVNGNNVRVRAGSVLPDFEKLKYVVQTKLSKGAEVEILGEEADGFLRIVPPEGVTVWVSRALVEMVPDELLRAERAAETALGADATGAVSASGDRTTNAGGAAARKTDEAESALASVPSTQQREKLAQLDAQAREELKKPIAERQFEGLIGEYKAIAESEGDDFAISYAEARAKQLEDMARLVETIRKMRRLSTAADSERRELLEQRAQINEGIPPIPSGVDAQGELRESALYPPGGLPRRYRLVDTKGGEDRTIGYIEIAPDADIEVKPYLGQYVGVRARAKRLQSGSVDPVPIYVLGELIPLQPAATATVPGVEGASGAADDQGGQ